MPRLRRISDADRRFVQMAEPIAQRVTSSLQADVYQQIRHRMFGGCLVGAQEPMPELPVLVTGLIQRTAGIEQRHEQGVAELEFDRPIPAVIEVINPQSALAIEQQIRWCEVAV